MEVFFTVGLLAVTAAGAAGFILGKKSVHIPDIEGRLEQQKRELQESCSAQLAAAQEYHNQQVETLKELHEKQLATVKESNEKQIEALKAMNKEQVESQINLIKEQMQTTSEKVLKMRQEELGAVNREQVSKIIDPLNATFKLMKEQMQKMEESVQKVNTDSAERKASITQTIEALAKETMKVGEQAGDLAKALKNKTRRHQADI